MNFAKVIWFFFILFTTSTAFAGNQLVYYEPSITKLTGIIKIKVSPGPPNYEDIKHGDIKEIGYYLVLDKPVDVNLLPHVKISDDVLNEPEKNMKVIQLVIMHDRDWVKMKEGNRVLLTGTLFHWFSGHHHTKVLMSVNKVALLKNKINKK